MNMLDTIIPKSDQLNADDLIGRDLTIKITAVDIKGGQEQPIAISFDDDAGKPYKPCKSMCRVMVTAWGADSQKYIGRTMTLYRDKTVKWGGMEVGGIRISHMSDIDSAITMALTVTRANKKPYTVKPIPAGTRTAASQTPAVDVHPSQPAQPATAAAQYITAEEALTLEVRCTENDIFVGALKKAAKVERLSLILTDDLPRAHTWLDAVISKRKEAATT